MAASTQQTASTARNAASQSASRPALGPEINRIAVLAASTTPISSGETPRGPRNAGTNGEATPNAAYMTARAAMTRGSAATSRNPLIAADNAPAHRAVASVAGNRAKFVLVQDGFFTCW